MSKRVLAVCLPLLTLVVATGCSTSNNGRGVASVSGSTVPSAMSSLSFAEQGLRHAQCMRAHGIPEADPQVQPNGGVRVGGGYDKQAVDQDMLSKAVEACKPYEPVLTGPDRDLKLQGALELARCMRAHGVENFPDPDANGRFQLPEEQTDPDYDQAWATCRTRASQSPSPGVTRS
jgi:hypothetical protein